MSEARLLQANIHFDNKMPKIENRHQSQTFYIKKKQSYFQSFWCFGWILLKLISMLSCHMITIYLPRVFNIDILNSTFNTSV